MARVVYCHHGIVVSILGWWSAAFGWPPGYKAFTTSTRALLVNCVVVVSHALSSCIAHLQEGSHIGPAVFHIALHWFDEQKLPIIVILGANVFCCCITHYSVNWRQQACHVVPLVYPYHRLTILSNGIARLRKEGHKCMSICPGHQQWQQAGPQGCHMAGAGWGRVCYLAADAATTFEYNRLLF